MKRTKYNLSNYRLVSSQLGRLTPLNFLEVLPGDTFQGSTTALIRLAPLVSPVMHPVRFTIHHWFVPWRLVWDQWDDFITVTDDETITLPERDLLVNALSTDHFARLPDYFGVPRQASLNFSDPAKMNLLPLRAYNLIWNEWYRDNDLQSELSLDNVFIQSVDWKKDRFTTARETPQTGNAVTVPVTGPITVETLRQAFAAQKFRELRSRYGSRYVEYLRSLGVTPSDARLQRPEFLGGGSQTIQFSEVLQTSETSGTAQGNMAGHGIAAVRSNSYRRFFSEHGLVLTLGFARPINMYSSGMPRLMYKRFSDDFWRKELEHVGQQPIAEAELAVGDSDSDATLRSAWGYQDRYDEYRHEQSRALCQFSTNVPQSYIGSFYNWSFSRNFATPPAFSWSLVSCDPRTDAFAQQGNFEHRLAIMSHNRTISRRLVGGAQPRLAL